MTASPTGRFWSGPGEPPRLELDAIVLRPIEDRDITFVEEVSADPFIPQFTTVPSVWSPDEGQAFIDRQKGRVAEGAGYPFVVERRSDSQTVGFIGIWFREIDQGHLTIGYFAAGSARRQGVMSAALIGLSDWAFAVLEPERHRLWIEGWNVASQKTGERAGFVHQPGVTGHEEVGGVMKELQAWDRHRGS